MGRWRPICRAATWSSRATRGATELGAGIERAISESLDLDVAVLIRSASQLARVLEENPFMKRACDPAHLHVTFLVDSPDRPAVTRIDAGRYVPDEFAVAGQHVYLHCPNGYGRTKLNNTFFERRLATAATTRNWRTVTALAELSAG